MILEYAYCIAYVAFFWYHILKVCSPACVSGTFQSSDCTEFTNRECTQCTSIANSAPNSVTCNATTDSRTSRCLDGFFKVTATEDDGTDTCSRTWISCIV